MQLVLGIESSCDDTAAAVVGGPVGQAPECLSNVIASQITQHAPFGGVVPELASREHLVNIVQVLQEATEPVGGVGALTGIAVTCGPGLVGSLLVGVQAAKGLALACRLPWIGIHHLEGHLSAALLQQPDLVYPHVALVVSGGHTLLLYVSAFGSYRILGGTRDDAAGEAFDKVAKALGLGYPGGIAIDRLSAQGDPKAFELPRPMATLKHFDFSFSGLKTAAMTTIRRLGGQLEGQTLADFCASLQEAIADVLTRKTVAAALDCGVQDVVLAGGVAANSGLRTKMTTRCENAGLRTLLPERKLCTDNGAMIAMAGWQRLTAGQRSNWRQPVQARWSLDTLEPVS